MKLFRIAIPFFASIAAALAADNAALPPLRIAISEKVMPGVNIADARAAFIVWTQELLRDTELRPVPNQEWLKSSEQILSDIRAGAVDLVGVTVLEYRQVAPYLDASRVLADDTQGDELLLIVRENSVINKLADLRGRTVLVFDHPSTVLSDQWLTVALAREGLEPPRQLLGRMTKNVKLSQVVLPVFFGQADACVATRRGVATMFELNPQLSKQLKILASSPMMASGFLTWRKDYPAQLKAPILERVLALRRIPTAQQVLTLFQAHGYAAHDFEYLHSALDLLDNYDRVTHRPGPKK